MPVSLIKELLTLLSLAAVIFFCSRFRSITVFIDVVPILLLLGINWPIPLVDFFSVSLLTGTSPLMFLMGRSGLLLPTILITVSIAKIIFIETIK